MKKLTVILLLTIASVQAQKNFRLSADAIDSVDVEAPIGLDLMAGNKNGITVYPNADNDHILISFAGKKSERKTITIHDISGRIVFTTGKSVENTYMVDVSALKKDLYIIEVWSGGKVYRKKWFNN
ncbi:T9SS type A sorting domain-containing protein [Flavobacterium sp.]|uniref:T9SS type A sorting domain-containing protein n=1 Tax=Flavobacterium sp. TaxID=239 RepID=UPI00286A85F3|nr:T9SS type A sorting domain-containing protein [Flavobacterium sp.]